MMGWIEADAERHVGPEGRYPAVRTDNPAEGARQAFARYGVKALWHLTHVSNLPSILSRGIMSLDVMQRDNIPWNCIADACVQQRREGTDPLHGIRVHEYVPLFLQPRNAMMYRLREQRNELCWLQVDPGVVADCSAFLLADGNVACSATRVFGKLTELDRLPWEVLNAAGWVGTPDGKRKRGAEVLVYPKVEASAIISVRHAADRLPPGSVDDNVFTLRSPELFF